MTWKRFAILIAVTAAAGLTIFAGMVARVTQVERVPSDVAEARFIGIRDSLALAPPVFVQARGGLTRRPPPDPPSLTRPGSLHVMAYRRHEHSLIQSTIPFWFLRLKMPAIQFALRETGVDLGRFAIGVDELERYGPSIVFEEETTSGDRALIWTE